MKIKMGKQYRTRDGVKVRILCVDADNEKYPIAGLLGSGEHSYVELFTTEGLKYVGLTCAIDLVEVTPWDDFVIDEPVMVRMFGMVTWNRRYFAGVLSSERLTCFVDGNTEWTADKAVHIWDECRRPTEEELEV